MDKSELYLLRRKKRITLKELSNHIKCSIAMVSYFERGERSFTEDNYEKYKSYILNK